MKPGDSDRLLTFNEGLSAKARSEGYTMEQATYETEPQENFQDKAVRNLYADLMLGLINDLKRGVNHEQLPIAVRAEAVTLRDLAISWIRGEFESTISFKECLFILTLSEAPFIKSLKEQGLFPLTPEEQEELDKQNASLLELANNEALVA